MNDQKSDDQRRIARAEAQLRTAALTWHYLADGPDRGRGRQAVEDLHAVCAELAAALENAGRKSEQGGADEDDTENQNQACTHA